MIDLIRFKNYKAFQEGEVKVRPITLIFGKNSSGKSAICKLFPLFSQALSSRISSPFMLDNNGIVLGGKYTDVFFNQQTSGLVLGVVNDNDDYVLDEFLIKGGVLSVYSSRWGNERTGYSKEYNYMDAQRVRGMLCPECVRDKNINASRFRFSVDYLSPIRSSVEYAVPFKGIGRYRKISPSGENAYDLLIDSYLQKTPLYPRVSNWMKNNLDGQELIIKRFAGESDLFGFYISRGRTQIPIMDVGQGISQFLPILVQSFYRGSSDISIFEQPALHLHPAAHAAVIERLANSAVQMKKRYIIETHSENVLLGLRRLISDPSSKIKPEDAVIYFIDNDNGVSTIEEITINKSGELSSWPAGVFSEGYELLASILKNKNLA